MAEVVPSSMLDSKDEIQTKRRRESKRRLAIFFLIGALASLALLSGLIYKFCRPNTEIAEHGKLQDGTSIAWGNASLTWAGGGDIEVIMGSMQNLKLNVTIHMETTGDVISARADDLFNMTSYITDQDGTRLGIYSTVLVPSSLVNISIGSAPITIPDVGVIVDLSGLSCSEGQNLCLDISANSATAQVDSNEETICIPIQTCKNQLSGTITLGKMDNQPLVVHMGRTVTFHLNVDIAMGTRTASFAGDINALFDFRMYIANSIGGASASVKVEAFATDNRAVQVCPQCSTGDMAIGYSDYDLFNLGCHEYNHACVDVVPANGSNWVWDENDRSTACTPFDQCKVSVDKPTAMIYNHDSEQFYLIMGITRTYNFSFTLETGNVNTGKIVGNNQELFRITASVSRGTPFNPEGTTPLVDAVVTETESEENTVGPSTSVVFNGTLLTLNLSLSTCEEYDMICWEVKPAAGANWYWYDASNSTSIVASCQSFEPNRLCRNTYKYIITKTRLHWHDAAAQCASHGTTLAEFHTDFEYNRYRHIDWKERLGGKIWFGLNDVTEEGVWVYEDGSPISVTYWKDGEPNDYEGVEDCGQIVPSFEWNDDDCNTTLKSVCQYASPCIPDFTCDNGNCVSRDQECDFYDDCGDASDEIYCPCYPDYACSDGTCLPSDKFCDDVNDCPDGEDESLCYNKPPPS